MLWEVDIYPAEGQPDRAARQIAAEAADLGLARDLAVTRRAGFLIQGELTPRTSSRSGPATVGRQRGRAILRWAAVGRRRRSPNLPPGRSHLVHVLPKPGVMDPVAQSTLAAIRDFGLKVEAVRTLRKYWFGAAGRRPASPAMPPSVLANDAIEQVVVGPLPFRPLELGRRTASSASRCRCAAWTTRRLERLEPRRAALSFAGRDADDPQPVSSSWAATRPTPSSKRSPKLGASIAATRRSPAAIAYRGPDGAAAVRQHAQGNDLRRHAAIPPQLARAGRSDWCVSVFEDNAGVVRFDDQYHVVFKVETHNHPSALEPYGGANTGLGGVIRDPLGTGLGAKPICNTDVFCFAPPDTPADALPPGVLHPRRVMQGRRLRRARLRQPDGHSDRQRGDLFRSALSRQSAGVLRQRRPVAARQSRTRRPQPGDTSWSSAAAPAATAFTGPRSAPPS